MTRVMLRDYIDCWAPRAFVFATLLAIPTAQILTIWDMPSDVLMFERSGVRIAMANANDEVQRAAMFVTSSNTDDEFACHRAIRAWRRARR